MHKKHRALEQFPRMKNNGKGRAVCMSREVCSRGCMRPLRAQKVVVGANGCDDHTLHPSYLLSAAQPTLARHLPVIKRLPRETLKAGTVYEVSSPLIDPSKIYFFTETTGPFI